MPKKSLAPLGLLILACGAPSDVPPPSPPSSAPSVSLLEEVTTQSGLEFVHRSERTAHLYMPEMMSSGGALLDVDGDGDLDLYLLQGGRFLEVSGLPSGLEDDSDRLYRNDLDRGQGLHFTEITSNTGSDRVKGFGMGAAVGDADGDGLADIYVTRLGNNRLLRSLGDGNFDDVTEEAGVGDASWSVPAVFFDYDRDGDLDLFVGNYIDFSVKAHRPCYSQNGSLDYCGPSAYPPTQDRLFRNRGDGTFEDVTQSSGLGGHLGSALGAVASDLDGDGWLDLYVANDERPNFLWHNRGDGTFEEIAGLAGCAVNMQGQPEASMGIGLGDLDQDGDDDILIAHLRGESNTVYLNDGTALFRDGTASSDLGGPSWPATSFGIGFLDLESDGRLDVFVANGAVRILDELAAAGEEFPLHQRNQLFLNLGNARFEERSPELESVLAPSEVSRSVLVGDIDNDGDSDLVVLNNNGPARILLSAGAPRNAWVGIRATLPKTGGNVLGARVTAQTSDGRESQARIATDGGYAAAGDSRALFGLGEAKGPVRISIRWPDGTIESWQGLGTGRYHSLQKGKGIEEEL